MSNLSISLKTLLERNQTSPAELARASGVSEPKLSRWLNGAQTYISDEDLEALAVGISKNPKERAELVIARLKDNLSGPGSEFVEITIAGRPMREDANAYKTTFPPGLQEAIPVLAQNWRDPDVRNIIQGLVNLLTGGDCSLSSSVPKPDSPDTGQSDTQHVRKEIEDVSQEFPGGVSYGKAKKKKSKR